MSLSVTVVCQDLTIIFFLFLSIFLSTSAFADTSLNLVLKQLPSAFGHRSLAHYIISLIHLDHNHYLSQGSSAVIMSRSKLTDDVYI